MKNKYFLIFLCVLFLCGTSIYFYSQSDFTYLTVIKESITSKTSNTSLSTFHTSSDSIVVSLNSTIEQGTLTITLTDSSGAVIKDFEVNSNYSEIVTVKKNNKYKLLVSYKNFMGDFEVRCK